MGKYRVTAGQHLYDVALHIYGSIEGITDLLLNNPGLSISDDLKSGSELFYSDGYVLNSSIVNHYKKNEIVPANGERHVYYKPVDAPVIAEFYLPSELTSSSFSISGKGKLTVNWGDNSDLQEILLTPEPTSVIHYFDNAIMGQRKILFYGNLSVQDLDVTGIYAEEIYLIQPLQVEKFSLFNSRADIGFLPFLHGLYQLDLSGFTTGNLSPLLLQKGLMEINLSRLNTKTEVLDSYLIALAKTHSERRSCTLTLSQTPTGEYREPEKDGSKYIIDSGMSAVWVLVNDPVESGGTWKIIINDTIYAKEL